MRGRAAVVAMVITTVGCAASAAKTEHPAAAHCGPATAKTLTANGRARVYQQGANVYGCSASSGRRFRLGASSITLDQPRVALVALAGGDAACALSSHGVDTGSAEVVVRRLTDGRVLHRAPAVSQVSGPESFSSVTALVVTRGGGAAWIGSSSSIATRGHRVEVRRVDARGRAMLDSGPGIGLRSLRLRGSRLTWADAGRERSATLS
jgi:hypothetical protein